MTVIGDKDGRGSSTDGQSVDLEVAALVRRAGASDRDAWDELVRRYVSLVWSIALRHGLSQSDAADVVQTTWLRLLEHINDIRDPARVGAWLATTAQRESLRVVALHRRMTPSDDYDVFDGADLTLPASDERLLAQEREQELRHAVDQLPSGWRSLMQLLLTDPPLSYEEISVRLSLPVGSIGPTRRRCMRRIQATIGPA